MTDHQDRKTTVDILKTPVVPNDQSREADLRAELRSAREVLAARKARDGNHSPIVMAPGEVAMPEHLGMSVPQLEGLVERLERDLEDLENGFEAIQTEGEE